jgi:hypothetical protein
MHKILQSAERALPSYVANLIQNMNVFEKFFNINQNVIITNSSIQATK